MDRRIPLCAEAVYVGKQAHSPQTASIGAIEGYRRFILYAVAIAMPCGEVQARNNLPRASGAVES